MRKGDNFILWNPYTWQNMKGSGIGWRRMTVVVSDRKDYSLRYSFHIPKPSGGHMTLLKLDYLPCGYKILRPDGDEIYSFLVGGEVDLVSGLFHFSV